MRIGGTRCAYIYISAWKHFKKIEELAEDEADYALTATDIECEQGQTADLSLSLVNKDVAVGIGFTLTLPEGVSVVNGDDGTPVAKLTDRAQGMTVTVSRLSDEDNVYVFDIVPSSEEYAISGGTGELLCVPLTISEEAAVGAASIEITLPSTTSESGRKHYMKPSSVALSIATDISTVNADEPTDKPVYDINGRRMSAKPAAGVYIQDGKKMVRKR